MLRRAWLPKALRATLLAVLVLAVAACGVGQQGPSQGGGGGGGPNKICMMPKLVGIPYFNAPSRGQMKRPRNWMSISCTTDPPRPKRRSNRR